MDATKHAAPMSAQLTCGDMPTCDMPTVKDTNREQLVLRILKEHARPVERLIACYARSEADRADLWQDVAFALWSAIPSFRGDCSERTFVLRIAHNRALTAVTKRQRRTEPLEEHVGNVAGTSGKNPSIAFEKGERNSRLLAAVRAIPVPLRQVITLLLEGLSYHEIAAVLGITENNVGVRANRARAAVRVLLEETETIKQVGAP